MKVELITSQDVKYPIGIYIDHNMIPIQRAVREFIHSELEPENINGKLADSEYINLVVMGSSGAICGTVAYQVLADTFPGKNIRIVHIKKEGESSHQLSGWPGFVEACNIFVDDFSNTGETIVNCWERAKEDFLMKYPKIDFQFDYAVMCGYITGKAIKKAQACGVVINKIYSHIIDELCIED